MPARVALDRDAARLAEQPLVLLLLDAAHPDAVHVREADDARGERTERIGAARFLDDPDALDPACLEFCDAPGIDPALDVDEGAALREPFLRAPGVGAEDARQFAGRRGAILHRRGDAVYRGHGDGEREFVALAVDDAAAFGRQRHHVTS